MAKTQNDTTDAVAETTEQRMRRTEIEKYEEKRAKKIQDRKANLAEQVKCLDPEYAAGVVASRPRYRFRVTAEVSRMQDGRRIVENRSEDVIAQTDTDAWAFFCDRNKIWPNRNASNASVVNCGKVEKE